MTYNEFVKDITTLTSKYVIAHCISTDCAMGAGVVVPICKKHPSLKKSCREFVGGGREYKSGKPFLVGDIYRFTDDCGTVYNMFTKCRVFENAQNMQGSDYLHNITNCLIKVRNSMIANDENYLGLPLIGCGIDRCSWNDVKKIIQDVFNDTSINVTIFDTPTAYAVGFLSEGKHKFATTIHFCCIQPQVRGVSSPHPMAEHIVP